MGFLGVISINYSAMPHPWGDWRCCDISSDALMYLPVHCPPAAERILIDPNQNTLLRFLRNRQQTLLGQFRYLLHLPCYIKWRSNATIVCNQGYLRNSFPEGCLCRWARNKALFHEMVISLYLREWIPFASWGIIQLKGRTLCQGMKSIGLTATLQIIPSKKMAFGPDIMIYFLLSIL